MNWQCTLKFAGLVVGCLAKFITGSVFCFNLYGNAIKEMFNYTQEEVELQSSLMNLGLGMGLLPGLLFDRFGPVSTSIMGLVISTTSYTLVWSTTRYVDFYTDKSWLMAIYFFMIGVGCVFTYMSALNTNIINFHRKHAGKIVGLLNACFAGSPLVFSLIYYNLFTHGDITIVKNQDFPSFMVFFAITFGICDILCVIFLRVYKDDTLGPYAYLKNEETGSVEILDIRLQQEMTSPANEQEGSTLQNESARPESDVSVIGHDEAVSEYKSIQQSNVANKKPVSSQKPAVVEALTFCQILKSLDYHLLAWMFAFGACTGVVVANNITVVSHSVHLNQYNQVIVIMLPISNAIISFLVGIFSDYFKYRISRMVIILAGLFMFVISQAIGTFFADVLVILLITTLMCGIATSVLWSLAPAEMSERFHVDNLGRNWGAALLLASVLAISSQEIFGALYDKMLSTSDQIYCYGLRCIQGGYSVLLATSVVSVALGGMLYVRQRRNTV